VYVNSKNHEFDAVEFIRQLPSHKIRQIHLAGHTDMGTHLFDTHNGPVIDPVWALYRETLRIHGQRPTIIEWDENVPTLDRLRQECALASVHAQGVLS
jgi:uncharacterized protein